MPLARNATWAQTPEDIAPFSISAHHLPKINEKPLIMAPDPLGLLPSTGQLTHPLRAWRAVQLHWSCTWWFHALTGPGAIESRRHELRRPGANGRIAACTSPVYLHDTISDKLARYRPLDLTGGFLDATCWGDRLLHALLVICRSVCAVINISHLTEQWGKLPSKAYT